MGLAKLHIKIAVLHWLFAVCLSGLVSPAFAGSAPEAVGQFTRSDGITVTAVKQESHTIFYFTGVRCWFTLPDGSTIAVPHAPRNATQPNEWERSCVVRTSDTSAEIYRFKKDAFPIAIRVLRFDGYKFTDITTRGKRWLSPLVHTWDHIAVYLVVLLFFATLALLHQLGRKFVKSKPRHGWWLAIRAVWFFVYALTAVVCAFLLLFVVTGWGGATSPLVFLIILAVGFVLYQQVNKMEYGDEKL